MLFNLVGLTYWPALRITDVAVRPLGSSSTDMATISYMLTESATVYVTIYPPNTQINYLTGAATDLTCTDCIDATDIGGNVVSTSGRTNQSIAYRPATATQVSQAQGGGNTPASWEELTREVAKLAEGK